MESESGTGWPSFFTTIPGAFGKTADYKLITEYHCIRCGGHDGHIFDDGPKPTGQRWCNNGVALKFIAKNAENGNVKSPVDIHHEGTKSTRVGIIII